MPWVQARSVIGRPLRVRIGTWPVRGKADGRARTKIQKGTYARAVFRATLRAIIAMSMARAPR